MAIRAFPQFKGLIDRGGKGERGEHAQVTGVFVRQDVRRESACRGGDSLRRGDSAGAGSGVGLTARWCGCLSPVMGSGVWGLEPSYGWGVEGARVGMVGWRSDTWKRGSLAGSMGVRSAARRRVSGILRSVLRGAYEPSYGVSSTRPYELMESVVTSTTIENWRATRGG